MGSGSLMPGRGRGTIVIIGMQGKPAVAEAGVVLQQPEACHVFSQGSCPWITGPWQWWWAAQAPSGGWWWGRVRVDNDLCLHTGFLLAAAAVSVSYQSLVSELIAVAHAHLLWADRERIPSLRTPRNNGLLPLRQVQSFSWTPSRLALPARSGTLAPFRLCSRSQPQSSPWDLISKARASAPSPHPPERVSRQASQAGEYWSSLILCAGISPLCPLHSCCCALLYGSKASPLPPLVSASEGTS